MVMISCCKVQQYPSLHPKCAQYNEHIFKLRVMLLAKRQAFHAQIRSRQICTMMAKIRCQLSKQQRTQALDFLIEGTQSTITLQQLQMLAKWGVMGEAHAVLHFGNLVIDGVVDVGMLEQLGMGKEDKEWYLGAGEEYLWLLHVLYEGDCFDAGKFTRLTQCLNRLVRESLEIGCVDKINRSVFFGEHGLCLLKKILRAHTSAAQLLLQESSKEKSNSLIENLCLLSFGEVSKEISKSVYSIMGILCLASSKQLSILNVITPDRLQKFISRGLLKIQAKSRALTYQILTNLVISYFQESWVWLIIKKVLRIALNSFEKQKNCVQLQISYLFVEIGQNISVQLLQAFLIQQNLTQNLKQALYFTLQRQALQNIGKTLRILHNLREQIKQPFVRAKLELSEQQLQAIPDFFHYL